jgi:hypoxanthine phosphoribosyltransferase
LFCFMSHIITIKDKQFKPFIKHEDLLRQVKNIANEINQQHHQDFPLFLSVLNGSFMFASDLMKEINIKSEISFIKMASYEGTQSTGTIKELIGLNEHIKDRTIIIIEDIVDTGHTIKNIYETLLQKGVNKVKIASALFKPSAYKGDLKIDYVGFEIPDNFVVGYGLDYDGLGRNLKDIYVLV